MIKIGNKFYGIAIINMILIVLIATFGNGLLFAFPLIAIHFIMAYVLGEKIKGKYK